MTPLVTGQLKLHSMDLLTHWRQNSTDTAACARCHKLHSWHDGSECVKFDLTEQRSFSIKITAKLCLFWTLCLNVNVYFIDAKLPLNCWRMSYLRVMCTGAETAPLRLPWWNISLTHIYNIRRLRFRGTREEDCMNIIFWILKGGIPYWQPNEYFNSLALSLAYCVDFFPLITTSLTEIHSARMVDFHVLNSCGFFFLFLKYILLNNANIINDDKIFTNKNTHRWLYHQL